MNVEWSGLSDREYHDLKNKNVRYASMEVDGDTDDYVEVYLNLNESGFTVVYITTDANTYEYVYRVCKRETYAGALAVAVQIAASIIPSSTIVH